MRKLISVFAVTVIVVLTTACKDKLEEMKQDGIQCARDKSMLLQQKDSPKQHCFLCNDDSSMMKCPTNPLTSGCTEMPCPAN